MSDETNLLQVSDFKHNILINYEIQKKKKSGCNSTEYFFNISLRSNVFITQCYHWFSWPCASFLNDSQQEKKVRFKTVFPLSFLRVYFQLPLKRPRKEGYTFDFERSTNFFVLCPIQRKKRQKSLKPNHYKMWWEGKPFFSTFSLSKAKLFLKEIGN